MCGISGFLNHEVTANIYKMTDSLIHRGPDDKGYYIDDLISIGMRRLSIIDAQSGAQPVFNEDKTIVLVFNGEIYNHHELRLMLKSKGHKFNSDHSDSEVLVHLYEEYKENFANYLYGMFAIAIWELNSKKIILCRDRVGIKPLYYFSNGKSFAFSSEIKAFFHIKEFNKEINYESLDWFLSFKNTPSPKSIYKDIFQVNPGELLVIDNNKINSKIWWDLKLEEDFSKSEDEFSLEVNGILKDSVRKCLVSDVDVGAFLSGGLDSSAVVALMSELTPKKFKTFSLVYPKSIVHKVDDRKFAKKISRIFETEHFELELTYEKFIDGLNGALFSFDEPFAGVISTYFLSELVSKHVKVALSGDGADELFGSYLSHRLAQPIDYLRLNKFNNLINLAEDKNISPFNNNIQFLLDRYNLDDVNLKLNLAVFSEKEKELLYSNDCKSNLFFSKSYVKDKLMLISKKTNDPLNRVLAYDFQTLLPDQVLKFVDHLSMAHSLEIRPPFLDHRLIELSFKIPGKLKIKDGNIKNILKRSLVDVLPYDLINRPKEGFVLPIEYWLKNNMEFYVRDILSPVNLNTHGFFNFDYVESLVNEFYINGRNHFQKLWTLISFQKWWNENY
jgi:asparagine synthase (glutamine-hydrolysing)